MSDSGVGKSKWTELKQKQFGTIVQMHLKVTDAVLSKHPYYKQTYHYIDATAGPGKYPVNTQEIDGSPLIFISRAETLKRKYHADLIESRSENFQLLQSVLPGLNSGTVKVHLADYAQLIPELLSAEDSNQFGLLYVDPNGMPDFATIAQVSKLRPKMEILTYLSATTLKREQYVTDQSLADFIATINKKNWLVRQHKKGDNHQWTFLLGSNSELFKEYKSIEFYKLNSEEAQAFFPKLNLSAKQRKDKSQPRLFD